MEKLKSVTCVAIILHMFIMCVTTQVVLFNQNKQAEDDSIASLMELDGSMRLSRQELQEQHEELSEKLQRDDTSRLSTEELFEDLSSWSQQKHSPSQETNNKDIYNNASQKPSGANQFNSHHIENPEKISSSLSSSSSSSSSSSPSLSLSSSSSNVNSQSDSSMQSAPSSSPSFYGDQKFNESDKLTETEYFQHELNRLDGLALEEFYLPFEDRLDDTPLFRSKRQVLQAGSGESLRTGQFTLIGANLNANEATADSPENILIRSSIGSIFQTFMANLYPRANIQVEITAVSSGSIVCDFNILWLADEASTTEIASGLDQLDEADNFKMADNQVDVGFPKLERDDGVSQPAICFLCESFQTCVQNADETWSCRTQDSNYFPFGIGNGDGTLEKDKEFYTQEITFEAGVPYNTELVRNLYIGVNGLISLKTSYASFRPRSLPVDGQDLIAPYWTDIDLISSDETSNVFYQLYERSDQNTPAQQAIFAQANSKLVASNLGIQNYDALYVLVVTWDALAPYPAAQNEDERVNFQFALITDGLTSYGSFVYPPDGLKFIPSINRKVTVGYKGQNLDSMSNYYVFSTVTGNTGEAGYWLFPLGQVPNYRAQCIDWFNRNINFFQVINQANGIVPRCPCSRTQAENNGLWRQSFLEANCYDMFPILQQLGRRCCYRTDGSDALETRIPLAGNLQLYTPYWFDLVSHERWDSDPKIWCCTAGSELCNLYYSLRPVRNCQNGRRNRRATGFGDPHVQTLDGRQYVFNGIGEYTLIDVDAERPENRATRFVLQARTCHALNDNGTNTGATVWCGIAGITTNGTTFSAAIANNEIEVYVNGEDFSSRFQTSPTFNDNRGDLSFTRKNNSILSFYSATDEIGVDVTLSGTLLDYTFIVDDSYAGLTKGLLGNFNGDLTDDFITADGSTISNNSTDEEIFAFGQTWQVTQDTSVFVYPAGKSVSDYSDPSFTPIFLDQADPKLVTEAEGVCGGASSIACVFDYVATRDENLALNTKTGLENFQSTEEALNNRAPVIEEEVELNTTVGDTFTFTLTAADPDEGDNVTFVIVQQPDDGQFTYTVDKNTLTGSFTPNSLDPVTISLAAKDSKNLESTIHAVEIRNCDCENGTCDYDKVLEGSTVYYSVVKCVCNVGWTGARCDQDFDGCSLNACAEGTTCTDLSPAEEAVQGTPFTCSDCPAGTVLAQNSTKCLDIDECDSNPCDVHAQCINLVGSFYCQCNDGYREAADHSCVDIDECTENNHECVQVCTNTFGGYNCSCYPGFESSGLLGVNCTRLPDQDPCSNLTKNCEYGCLRDGDNPVCFCPTGYKVAADGKTCENINECDERLCSQSCTDTEGSYTCGCYVGFVLDDDKHGCHRCEENKYGVDCSRRCECRGRTEVPCDNVQGCICVAGWTGEFCHIDVDECLNPNICPGDQLCTNTNGSHTCQCPTGYQENENRECVDIDECASYQVHNCSQNCRNNPGSYSCFCNDGYSYNSVDNQCEDIDECAIEISGCGHLCFNNEGSFTCGCEQGFALASDRKTCSTVEDVCADSGLQCSFACTLISEEPVCICSPGYFLGNDNQTCIDVDECGNSDANSCSEICENNDGSYTCKCQVGKELKSDLRTCTECDGFHWGDNCVNQCACNPLGTKECNKVTGCVCEDGWNGDDCSLDIDECNRNTEFCSGDSVCVNNAGSYRCDCNIGYQRENDVCVDINECEDNPCHQQCTNNDGSYTCSCEAGFLPDANVCNDIDECESTSTNNCEQICRNTQGSYACECEDGYLLNTTNSERNTCYADPNAEQCANDNGCDYCRRTNSEDICFCLPGYELSNDNKTCEDINECAAATSPCQGQGSLCSNTPGGFNCSCNEAGYKLADDLRTCIGCLSHRYGMNCDSECSCDFTHTLDCSTVNGTCTCQPGWDGADCDVDVDECLVEDCGDNANCFNTNGSFSCRCDIGFAFSGLQKCQPCDSHSYGIDCLNECSCEMEHTVDCNDVNGNCTCKEGWEGATCEKNIDECTVNPNYCPHEREVCNDLEGSVECVCIPGYTMTDGFCVDNNECLLDGQSDCVFPRICNNTVGSFECVCAEGYEQDGVDCTADYVIFHVNFTFNFSDATVSNVPPGLDQLLENELFNFGRTKIGMALLRIIVRNVRLGSIIADLEIQINNKYSEDPTFDVTRLVDSIATEASFDVNNEKVNVSAVEMNNLPYDPDVPICDKYFALGGSCTPSSYVCVTKNGLPTCVRDSDATDSDYELQIGLGVGIPLFIILCIVIAIAVYLYLRDKKKRSAQSTPSADRDAPFRSLFATQMAPKGSWGAPARLGMYSPDAYSEAGTSESSHDGGGQLMKSRQKVRSDFQDSPWYDNRGATPRETPREPTNDSHGAPTESGAPTSNFSWEYMFRLLEPHRGFEIQRPNVTASPNPAYEYEP